jgi:hypothetical protein
MLKWAKIRKRKNKDQWKVYSEEGKPLSKWYDSEKKAKERLKQIEYFKHNSADDLSIIDLVDQSNYDMPTLNRKNTDVFPHTKNSMYLYPGGPEVLGGKQTPYIDQDDSEDYFRFFEGESEADLPPVNEKGKRMNKRLLRKEEVRALSAAYNLDTFEKRAYTDYLSSSTNSLSRSIYVKAINYAFYKCIKESNYLTDFSKIRKIERNILIDNMLRKEALSTMWSMGLGALIGNQILGSQALTNQISNGITVLYNDAKKLGNEAVGKLEDVYDYITNDLITDLGSFVSHVDSFLLSHGVDLPSLIQTGLSKVYNNGRLAFEKLGDVINSQTIRSALKQVDYSYHEQLRVKTFFTTELAYFSQVKERKIIESISKYIDSSLEVVHASQGGPIVKDFVGSIMDFSSEIDSFIKIVLPAKARSQDYGLFDVEGLNEQMVKEEVIMFHNFPMYFQEMILMYDKALGKATLSKYKQIGSLVASQLKP